MNNNYFMANFRCIAIFPAFLAFFFMFTKAALNFEGQTFSERDFTEDYQGDDLVGANFKKCVITNCSFIGLNLTDADFSDATLIAQGGPGEPNLDGQPKNIYFNSAILTRARFDGAFIKSQGGKGQDFVSGSSAGSGGNATICFNGANLVGASFNRATIEAIGGANGSGDNPNGLGNGGNGDVTFESAILTGADFSEVTLNAHNLASVGGSGVISFYRNQSAANINFTNAHILSQSGGVVDFVESALRGSNFFKARIESSGGRMLFTSANLSETNFKDSTIIARNGSDVNLIQVNFTQANLNNAFFDVQDSGGIYMFGAVLSYANFSGATCANVHFYQCISGPINFDNTIFLGAATPVPDVYYTGTPITNSTLGIGPIIANHHSNIDLSRIDLTGVDLSHIVLDKANLKGAVLKGTDLTGARIINTTGFDQLNYLGTNINAYSSIKTMESLAYLCFRNNKAVPLLF